MTDFETLAGHLLSLAKAVREKKGRDYAGKNESRYKNFDDMAARLGVTRYQAWAIYALKHTDSICNAVKENPAKPQCHGEPLVERLIDTINYALLLYGMAVEDGLMGPLEDQL